ncbi:hypothetical protein BJX68DRAFT_227872 [Aspergillus pseudodeflectus]|uniref:Uncharacterized protein n=1 Tax=Aspergillus pseudodeflectus TaxID=176178 RepID=A0ABR4L0M5_9EURO
MRSDLPLSICSVARRLSQVTIAYSRLTSNAASVRSSPLIMRLLFQWPKTQIRALDNNSDTPPLIPVPWSENIYVSPVHKQIMASRLESRQEKFFLGSDRNAEPQSLTQAAARAIQKPHRIKSGLDSRQRVETYSKRLLLRPQISTAPYSIPLAHLQPTYVCSRSVAQHSTAPLVEPSGSRLEPKFLRPCVSRLNHRYLYAE